MVQKVSTTSTWVDKTAKRKARNDLRRAAGLCTKCGEEPLASNSKAACIKCKEKKAAYDKKKRVNTLGRLATEHRSTVCLSCVKRPRIDGYKSCQECIDRRKEQTQQIKLEVFAAYGGNVCACCKQVKDVWFLQIDHINNNGAEFRRNVVAGGSSTYRWLKRNNYPEGFQLLCCDCNWGKHINNGVCPHQDPLLLATQAKTDALAAPFHCIAVHGTHRCQDRSFSSMLLNRQATATAEIALAA